MHAVVAKTRVAALIGVVLVGCAGVRTEPTGSVIQCDGTRNECAQESLDSMGNFTCEAFQTTPITATVCAEGSETPDQACGRVLCTPDGFSAPYGIPYCSFKGKTTLLPNRGVCSSDTRSKNPDFVSFARSGRDCTLDSTHVACSSLTQDIETHLTQCVDLSSAPATQALLLPDNVRYRTISISAIELDSATHCATAALAAPLVYAVPAGPLGSAQGGGVTATVSALDGFATLNQTCDVDAGCQPSSLASLRVNLGNLNVLGMPVTNLVARSVVAAPLESVPVGEGYGTGVAAGNLELMLDGRVGGQRVEYLAANQTPLTVSADPTNLELAGTFEVVSADTSGHRTPVTFDLDLRAPAATAQERTCSQAGAAARVLGFESAESWSSSNATLTHASSPVTQGCGALGVTGQGFLAIAGANFSTQQITVTPALSVDLFIPDHQPNQFYLGALQMLLTCPSGNVFNQYIGQVELTGKPQNAYSTLRFPLPAAVQGTLQRSLDDCSLSLGLNVNATGKSWFLDNLRFTQ
jgi:hypothetical protein